MPISSAYQLTVLEAVRAQATWVQLHGANPGPLCTANIASQSARVTVSFDAATSFGLISNNDVLWTSMPASETIRYISIWTALTAGTPLWYGPLLTPRSITAGNDFQFDAATITLIVQ